MTEGEICGDSSSNGGGEGAVMELNSPGEITAGPDLWGREDSTVGSCSALTTRNAFLGLKTVTLYEKKKNDLQQGESKTEIFYRDLFCRQQ